MMQTDTTVVRSRKQVQGHIAMQTNLKVIVARQEVAEAVRSIIYLILRDTQRHLMPFIVHFISSS
jgi:hypothetical protein